MKRTTTHRIGIALLITTIVALIACEQSKRQSEKCLEGGHLYGTKWCDATDPGWTTYDLDLLEGIKKRAASCYSHVDSLSDREKLAMQRNANDFASLDEYVPEAYVWSYAFGRCWDPIDTSKNFAATELRPLITAFMNSRWKTDTAEFVKYYPSCNLQIPIRPYSEHVPYGVTGCSPDTTSAGNTRIPTGSIDVVAKIHFNAFYDQILYNSPDPAVPNFIPTDNSIEYVQEMITQKQIRHDIPAASPPINQSIKVDSVVATSWEHKTLPTTNFWSKNSGHYTNLETPIVITALTQIYDGNSGNPTRLYSRFLGPDSTDRTGTFNDRNKFNYHHGEDEFIKYHRDGLGIKWIDDSIRYTQIHFNFMYVERSVSYIHLFMETTFDGLSTKEMFCTCTGAQCFTDTSYVAGCSDHGERKFVPPQEDSIYQSFAVSRYDYDGLYGDPPHTGNEELKSFFKKEINDLAAYTLPDKGAYNNSFYIFPIRSAWVKLFANSGSYSHAEAFQKGVVAHEIGHYVFGFVHSNNNQHIMAPAIPDLDTKPILTLPFYTITGAKIDGFTLAPGIWSQPVNR